MHHNHILDPLGLLGLLWGSLGVGRLLAMASPDMLGPWANAIAGALLIVGTAGLTVWGQVRNKAREEAAKDEDRRRSSLTAQIEELTARLDEATAAREGIRQELDGLQGRHEDLLKLLESRNTAKP
jgi:hypothetical protein